MNKLTIALSGIATAASLICLVLLSAIYRNMAQQPAAIQSAVSNGFSSVAANVENQSVIIQSALTRVDEKTDKAINAAQSSLSTALKSIDSKTEQQTALIQSTLEGAEEKTSKTINAAQLGLTNGLGAMDAKIDQQSLLINRCLGKVIPLALPPDIMTSLSNIETRLDNESSWPTSTNDLQVFNRTLVTIVNGLPPWAQEELLPRIIPRRWEIDALWTLAIKPNDNDADLLAHAKALESLISQKPMNASDHLNEMLQESLTNCEKLISANERASAITKAKAAVDGKGDIEAAAKLIAQYSDVESKNISELLRNRIISDTLLQIISNLRKELQSYDTLPDLALRQYAFNKTFQTLLDLRLRVSTQTIVEQSILTNLDALEKDI